MENLDYLYDLINKNEVTLIGYRFSDERIKDEIISNLGRSEIIDLNSSFSMKSLKAGIFFKSVVAVCSNLLGSEKISL